MGVGGHHVVQMIHAQLLQIGQQVILMVPRPAVNEHRRPCAAQQGGIPLSHVQKVHGQLALRLRLRDAGLIPRQSALNVRVAEQGQ